MQAKEFANVREKCILDTKRNIRDSVNEDYLIIQAVSSIDELDKMINTIVVRLREWYELYNPEFSARLKNNERFVELILAKDKKTLLSEIEVKESMGSDLAKKDLDSIMDLAKEANSLIKFRDRQKEYIETTLKQYCPNALEILGASLAGKMLKHAGSLKRLAFTTAPVIQIMGAEKSLFKHLKTQSRPPKYGILFAHPLLGKVYKGNRGKMARAIADKTSIALKTDYFKGNFIGDKLRKELEEKANLLKK